MFVQLLDQEIGLGSGRFSSIDGSSCTKCIFFSIGEVLSLYSALSFSWTMWIAPRSSLSLLQRELRGCDSKIENGAGTVMRRKVDGREAMWKEKEHVSEVL